MVRIEKIEKKDLGRQWILPDNPFEAINVKLIHMLIIFDEKVFED